MVAKATGCLKNPPTIVTGTPGYPVARLCIDIPKK